MNANVIQTASDISGHWAEETIQEWIDKDWVKGYLDGSFKPNDYITRAEFVALVNRSFQFTATGPTSFTDVNQNAWYASAVGIAVRAGYIQGYNDNTMKPENHISREEAATIIMKINNLTANSTATNVFTDSGFLTWSKGAVGAVAAANLMTGYPDRTFGPDRMIRRGETVVLLDRSVKYIDLMDAPAAPDVTNDDVANTVTGMTSAMEYKLDDGIWTSYVASVFDDLDLSGDHTLLVRYEAIGILPSGLITTLTFTTASTGGGGTTYIAVTDLTITGDAIVGSTLTATPTPGAATGTYQWIIADSTDGIYEDIAGATSSTYLIDGAYAGQFIKVTFTGTSRYTGSQTSDATGPILTVADALAAEEASLAYIAAGGLEADAVYVAVQVTLAADPLVRADIEDATVVLVAATKVLVDQAAADEVDALIAALPAAGTVTLAHQTQIEEARVAYDLLTAEQVALMTEEEATLIAAEVELAAL